MKSKNSPSLVTAILSLLVLSLLSLPTTSSPTPSLLDRHEAQLARLESLLESLAETVSRLESSLPVSPPKNPQNFPPNLPSKSVSVTKFEPSWPERFKLAAAAKLKSQATAAAVLPHEDPNGLTKYFVVGDSDGAAYVISAAGDVIIEIPPPPLTSSPVTSMLAYASRRNESLLLTGHQDGSIWAHRITESSSEEWPTISLSRPSLFLNGSGSVGGAILHLGVFAAGRVKYVAAGDAAARIRVFTEDGTLYGSTAASNPILAFSKHRLLFLTESGAGSLDLRTMAVKETNCEGLNRTQVVSYAFDVAERSKAYGITSEGVLVQIVILGDAASIKCRVRVARKVEISGAAVMQTIRGYLIAADEEKIHVFNVSSGQYGRAGAPRLLFSSSLGEITSQFSMATPEGMRVEVMAADKEKLLVLGLGGGYVAVYRSHFPVYKVESGGLLWSSPVLVFVIFLIGMWHFYAKKKDALVWSPEEEFNDGSFSGDDGGTSRYVSPPGRYGGAQPFRAVAADSGFRGGEIKYRATQRIEPSGFPKRRDAIVGNSQGMAEDHKD